MKIAQVCPRYFPHIGGVEEHVRNISERLAGEHEVTVLTTDAVIIAKQVKEMILSNKPRFSRTGETHHLTFSWGCARFSQISAFHREKFPNTEREPERRLGWHISRAKCAVVRRTIPSVKAAI